MKKAEANMILDAAKAGAPVPIHQIDEALRATGDLTEEKSQHRRGVGEWERIAEPGARAASIFDGLL